MQWNLERILISIRKCILYGYAVAFFISSHLAILLLTHAAIIMMREGGNVNTALATVLEAVEANRWADGYLLIRETILDDLPFASSINKFFISHNTLTWMDLFFDTVKATCGGLFAYILCRINKLISSKKHPIIFHVLYSYWISVSTFSALLLVVYLQTLSDSLCIGLCTVILVLSVLLLILFSSVSIHKMGITLKTKRIFRIYIITFLEGIMNSLFIHIVSCISFDILRPWLANDVLLLFTMMCIAGFLTIVYNLFKEIIKS